METRFALDNDGKGSLAIGELRSDELLGRNVGGWDADMKSDNPVLSDTGSQEIVKVDYINGG